MMSNQFEYFATPAAFTTWLFAEMAHQGMPIVGRLFEPCVGDGAIVRAAAHNEWVTNDLDPRWPADHHFDAAGPWPLDTVDWTVTNPPFTLALKIIDRALVYSRVGVAMHLRASIHEVLKTGVRRRWMGDHLPTGILWLPRFAYQRSPTTGKGTTDSMCACWVVFLKDHPRQFISYAPESLIDALDVQTATYRRSIDAIMAGRG